MHANQDIDNSRNNEDMDVDFEYDESIELSHFPTQSELNDLIRQMKKINIR